MSDRRMIIMSSFKAVVNELEKTKKLVSDEINRLTLYGNNLTIIPNPENIEDIKYLVKPLDEKINPFELTLNDLKDISQYYEFIKEKV